MDGDESVDGDKEMNLRYAGKCALCGEGIPRGVRAIYSPPARSVRHIDCNAGLERGVAGGSARREYERRKARDAARVSEQRTNSSRAFSGRSNG